MTTLTASAPLIETRPSPMFWIITSKQAGTELFRNGTGRIRQIRERHGLAKMLEWCDARDICVDCIQRLGDTNKAAYLS